MTREDCIINLLKKGFLYTSLPTCNSHLNNLVCEILNTNMECSVNRSTDKIIIGLPFDDAQLSLSFNLKNTFVVSISKN